MTFLTRRSQFFQEEKTTSFYVIQVGAEESLQGPPSAVSFSWQQELAAQFLQLGELLDLWAREAGTFDTAT